MNRHLISASAAFVSLLLIAFFSFSYAQENPFSILGINSGVDERIELSEERTELLQKNLKTYNEGGESSITKKASLSPDREYIAVTELRSKEETVTYITDKSGKPVTESKNGSFVSWSPDSSKALLFLSDSVNEKGRQIYYLSVDGKYENSDLPIGVISADMSPTDGSVIFSVTDSGSDISTVYLREGKGRDKVLLKDNSSIIAWLKWSPDGSKFAYLESNLAISGDKQEIKLVDMSTREPYTVSKVNWAFPPVWSKDSNKILFANKSNIFEFSTKDMILEKKSDFSAGTALHPHYSEAEDYVVFSRLLSTGKEVWLIDNTASSSVVSTGLNGDHPIITKP